MTNLDPAPIDRTHAESVALRDAIRRRVAQLKDQAAMWSPGPMPDEWHEPPIPRHIKITRRMR